MSYMVCYCRCHQDEVADIKEKETASGFSGPPREFPLKPVPVFGASGSIEAVTACNDCLKVHVPILKVRTIWSDRPDIDPTAWLKIQPANLPKAD